MSLDGPRQGTPFCPAGAQQGKSCEEDAARFPCGVRARCRRRRPPLRLGTWVDFTPCSSPQRLPGKRPDLLAPPKRARTLIARQHKSLTCPRADCLWYAGCVMIIKAAWAQASLLWIIGLIGTYAYWWWVASAYRAGLRVALYGWGLGAQPCTCPRADGSLLRKQGHPQPHRLV